MESTLRSGRGAASPIEGKGMFITDGGLETTLIFHHGMELPHFAAFDLLKSRDGYEVIRSYYHHYALIANKYGQNFILESPTWRANPDWGSLLGYDHQSLDHANRQAIEMMKAIKLSYQSEESLFLISGCVGPRGDGYSIESKMTVQEAREYHSPQVRSFAKAEVDLVTGVTMTYVEEALGLVLAAADHNLPVVISFTVETDGNLPSSQSLQQAIQQIDDNAEVLPIYYMVNCAHPSHFMQVLHTDASWTHRIHGIRANASKKSHAELDECTELDEGNPTALGTEYAQLKVLLPNLKVIGGCCGTDHRHIAAICEALFPN